MTAQRDAATLKFDMIGIVFPDKADMVRLSPSQLRDGLHFQLSNALLAARQQQVSTVLISLHGSIEHGQEDSGAGTDLLTRHPEIAADALVRAVLEHGSDLRVVIPCHGDDMNAHVSARTSDLVTTQVLPQKVWTPQS